MNIDYTIGDDIVAICDSPDKKYKEGELFIAKGLATGCNHFPFLVDVGFKTDYKTCGCPKCGVIFSSISQYCIADNFKKLDTLVNISELMEVLEQPAFS